MTSSKNASTPSVSSLSFSFSQAEHRCSPSLAPPLLLASSPSAPGHHLPPFAPSQFPSCIADSQVGGSAPLWPRPGPSPPRRASSWSSVTRTCGQMTVEQWNSSTAWWTALCQRCLQIAGFGWSSTSGAYRFGGLEDCCGGFNASNKQCQRSLLSEANWGKLEIKPKRNKDKRSTKKKTQDSR